MKSLSIAFVACLMVTAPHTASAAPRPDLYPNKHLNQVGPERARHDVSDCQIAGEDYVSQQAKSPARGVAKQAVGGAALGALGATIMGGNAGRGAGAGAAIGGLKGLGAQRKENKEGSPEYRQYVEACLEDRGYKVVGWKA
jgi:outer membrane lipoprotein SlyB